MTGPTGPLRVAILQTAPVLADLDSNVAAIAAAARQTDLLVTPELSLTGYDLRDAVHELALSVSIGAAPAAALSPLADPECAAVIVGLVERTGTGVPCNSAVLISGGVVRHRHRKIYLPTYGVFDEARWFGRGRAVHLVEHAGWRIAILICEDFWHPSLVYAAAMAGADVLVVPAAAPGRGAIEGDPAGGRFASSVAWTELARVSARTHGMYVLLCNRVGVEDGITFAGGSLAVGPDGAILGHAPDDAEARLDVVLDPAEIVRARRPYAHIRDEDPRILVEALAALGAIP